MSACRTLIAAGLLFRAPIQLASQRPRFDPVSGLQRVMAHAIGRGFAVGTERRDFPEFDAEQAPKFAAQVHISQAIGAVLAD